jgi:2-amino-4-hydroxy-6-hydroxymethyldihydropteridine diphosphokinase
MELERRAGRMGGVRWGPRPLDVDLLLYGEHRIDEPDLVVPHPRLAERLFVLEPLAEVALDWPVPGTGRTVSELLADLRHDP